MIISLRGTNGAGKSTIVRKIMDLYLTEIKVYEDCRKKPLCQVLRHLKRPSKTKDYLGLSLMVPGHYEIGNGGVDTLPSLDKAYELIKISGDMGQHVLYEGKNMSDSVARVVALRNEGYAVTVVAIEISDKEAVAAVRERGHKIKAETIKKLNLKTAKEVVAFQKVGVPVFYLPRDKAFKKIRQLLGV